MITYHRLLVIFAVLVVLISSVIFFSGSTKKGLDKLGPCEGEINKKFVSSDGRATVLSGAMTIQFTAPEAGRVVVEGWVTDPRGVHHRIHRLGSFSATPEGPGGLYLTQITEVSKAVDDNISDGVLAPIGLLSKNKSYIGLYRLASDVLSVSQGGLPFFTCSFQALSE